MRRPARAGGHVAANADLSNPTLTTLCDKLQHACGIPIDKANWSRTLRDSDCWMQVRHCLTHGLVTGTAPANWPGPVTKKATAAQAKLPKAADVLAVSPTSTKRSLTFYSAVNCCLVYSLGAAAVASEVAAVLGQQVDTQKLPLFDTV